MANSVSHQYLQAEEQCGVRTPQSVAGTIVRETSLQGNMAISTMSGCGGVVDVLSPMMVWNSEGYNVFPRTAAAGC